MSLSTCGTILRRFTGPIRKQAKLILVITLVVLVPILYIEIRFDKLINRNLEDILMLMCEVATESGDDFINARKDHAAMLEHYIGHMEQRPLSRFLRALNPELSPEVQLKPLLENLRRPVSNQQEAREEIEEARKTFKQFIRNSVKSSDLQVSTFKSEVLPEYLIRDVEETLRRSHEAVDEFEKNSNFKNAEGACRANRRAIALVYLVRFGYQNLIDQDRIKQFRNNIERTIYYNVILQKAVSDKERYLLRRYSKSEYRRLMIVEAILDNDMLKARRLLIEAIEEAYNTER
ncbi:MAG: hypothetical protein HQ580_09255 [Planctomycetes bacterium]|nr:hypothetical protein [Planctomycetota bacterium]